MNSTNIDIEYIHQFYTLFILAFKLLLERNVRIREIKLFILFVFERT